MRALEGLALAGLPAVAMAYLTEEVHPAALGGAIGLYIGGNAIGGMAGRLLAGGLADLGGWRLAIAGVGALGVACALTLLRVLPASRNFHAAPARRRARRWTGCARRCRTRACCASTRWARC